MLTANPRHNSTASRVSLHSPGRSSRSTRVAGPTPRRSEEHTSELQSRENLVCRLLLEKKNTNLHTDHERDYFIQLYSHFSSSFCGMTSYDSYTRPLFVLRYTLCASSSYLCA